MLQGVTELPLKHTPRSPLSSDLEKPLHGWPWEGPQLTDDPAVSSHTLLGGGERVSEGQPSSQPLLSDSHSPLSTEVACSARPHPLPSPTPTHRPQPIWSPL